MGDVITEECAKCKFPIHMLRSTQEFLRSSCQTFYCLSGHAQSYRPGKSDAEKLQEQLDAERRARQRAEQKIARERPEWLSLAHDGRS